MSYKAILDNADDRIMSMVELKDDDLFKRIPQDKIDYYIDESMKIGLDIAVDTMRKHNNMSIVDICKEKQVKVELDTKEYEFEIVKLRGKYEEDKKKIILYDLSIKRMESAYKNLNIKILDYKFLYEILLAQELFHYIEAEEVGKVSDKLDKVNAFKLGPIKKEYPIMKIRNIGANIFTKKILNLSFNPKALNYLYLLGTGHIDEESLLNYFDELEHNILNL